MRVLAVVLLAACPASLAAQPVTLPGSLTPVTNELPQASYVPLMVRDSRLQVLYDANELGSRTQLVVAAVAMRFDGPTGGTVRSHTIERLTLRLGASSVDPAQAGSVFAANLSQALSTPLRDVRFQFTTDGNALPGPEPFGAGGQLRFPLAQPVAITIPPGGSFVFELACSGNDTGGAPAHLDCAIDPANGQQPGIAFSNGRGCPLGATLPGPVLESTGVYEPGGSIGIVGRDFAPHTSVGIVITAHLFASPVAFPSTTPICWSYVDPGTTLLTLGATSSGAGTVSGGEPLPVPKRPPPAGAVLYVQSVTPVAPFTGNTFGLASSNYRTVQIGGPKTATVGAWMAASTSSASAAVAGAAFYGGLALQLL